MGLALALSLTSSGACSSDPDPAASDPTPATTSATTDESASTEPEADAATGPVIQEQRFRVNLPQGFRRSPATSTILESGYAVHGDPAQITVAHLTNIGGSSLASVAKTYRHTEGRALVRQDDALLGGEPALHLVGDVGGQHVEVYALVRGGEAVELRFMLTTDKGAQAAHEALIESVLASWAWR